MSNQQEPVELTVARKINQLDFTGAENLLAEWLADDPENLRGQASLARLRMMQERFEAAATIYESLTGQQPGQASFHSCLGQCYSILDNPLAERAFQAAIQREPANPYYRKLLERHHLKRGEGALALAVYDDRLAADPTDLNSLLCRGQLLDTLGLDGAEACLRRAVDAGPEYMRPLLLLGGFLARRERDDEAADVFDQALAFSGPEQLQWEQRSRKVSLYPCLELLWHAALAARGRFRELNAALAAFTDKHAGMLHDPRSFHDIVALDGLFSEYSYEEGAAFYFRRLKTTGNVHAYHGEALELAEFWTHSPGGGLLTQLRERVERLETAAEPAGTVSNPPGDDGIAGSSRAADRLTRALLAIADSQLAVRTRDLPLRDEAFARADRWIRDVAPDDGLPLTRWLVQAWLDVLRGQFADSNQAYHRYLSMDPDLSVTLVIFQHSGWFLMQ